MLNFTNPNGSTDIVNIWLDVKRDTQGDGDVWLYFGWQRDSSKGSSVISYEFQTAAPNPACDYTGVDQIEPMDANETTLTGACNPWSNRQAGDFMIVWDFGGGSTDVILRRFDGFDFDAGENLTAAGFAIAAQSADTSRGEGAINLSEAIFKTLASCVSVANVIPGTITGNSDQADYKDTVLVDVSSLLTISNCGEVKITKATVPAGEKGSFSYLLERAGSGDIDYTPRTSAGGTLIDDGGSVELTVIPGDDYVLTEDLTGEPTFGLESILCDKPAPNTDGSAFAVEPSAMTLCTITNELLIGTLTVVKTVVNPYGEPALASDFCLSLQDTENTGDFYGSSSGTQFSFLEGNTYDVTEVPCGNPDTSPPGYEPSYSGECSGTIEALVDKTCTVTNTLQAQDTAPLTLVKNLIVDNGGTASASDWTLSASLKTGAPGVCTASGFSGPGSASGLEGSASVSDDLAQCVYVLDETGGVSGYTASEWSCEGDFNLNGDELTVGADGATCTITNDDDALSLTLVKQVVNDNGGAAVASDWTLTAAGYDPADPHAGTYALSESGPAGYTRTSLSCDNAEGQVTSVTLGLGEDVTCTFVNDDDAPSLALVKAVNNDNGGEAVAGDWTLMADGPTPISGAGGGSSGGSFKVGTYALSESGLGNYSSGGWSCVGGTQDGSSVTLGLGESAVCTIINDDDAPSLTLVKNVINDNGGTAVASDWTLTAAGYDPADPQTGTYDLSESGPDGYTRTSLTCDNAEGQVTSVTLGLGEDVTCTFVNDDIPPALTIVKTPDSGMISPGDVATFTITVTNTGGGDALGVTLDDTLPSPNGNLTWSTSTPNCMVTGDVTLHCDLGTLDHDGGSAEVTVSATIPADYLDPAGVPSGAGTLGSNFEVDGDMVDGGGGLPEDWGTLGLDFEDVLDPPATDLSPDFLTDNAFGKGAKEDDPVPGVVDSSVPPNKSDLTHFLFDEDAVDGNVFLALGWLRMNSLGTSNFDFELNQSSALSTNGVTAERMTGDILLSFDFDSGGGDVALTLREWDGTALAWGPPQDLNSEGTAYGAVNDPITFGTTPDGEFNTLTGDLLLDNTFGEAVVNLTQTFSSDCRSFASAYVKSRSSTSFTSALKDFVAPIPVDINTCQLVPLPNTATAGATNSDEDDVSDTGLISITNYPAAGVGL
jgi:uncharacterized repeat protein (TIGR01451 family)